MLGIYRYHLKYRMSMVGCHVTSNVHSISLNQFPFKQYQTVPPALSALAYTPVKPSLLQTTQNLTRKLPRGAPPGWPILIKQKP